ncbi:hypothetical protein ACS0TY_011766 [Phlomoides rotata]
MSCFTRVNPVAVGVLHLNQMKYSSGRRMMMITMRDRSKNRKPLQKGRSLSIEAIQTVQALKRASKSAEVSLEQVYDSKFRRLLKFDMIAVLRELIRQNQCLLALKVFEDVRKEEWYRPQLLLYAEMVAALGSNGLLENVKQLIIELKAETNVNPDLRGFNTLLESLMGSNLTGLAVECYYFMKSVSCDPDRQTFKILIEGLTSNGEMDLLAVIQQEAHKFYGPFWDFIDEEESEMISTCKY